MGKNGLVESTPKVTKSHERIHIHSPKLKPPCKAHKHNYSNIPTVQNLSIEENQKKKTFLLSNNLG